MSFDEITKLNENCQVLKADWNKRSLEDDQTEYQSRLHIRALTVTNHQLTARDLIEKTKTIEQEIEDYKRNIDVVNGQIILLQEKKSQVEFICNEILGS